MHNVYDSDYSSSEPLWITEWCTDARNTFLVEVPHTYIYDNFNLFGLQAAVPSYESALSRILDEDDSLDGIAEDDEVESSAELLYGMIHSRYLTTSAGLKTLREKVKHCEYGTCPRILCPNQPLIPCGLTENFGQQTVRVYCPRCQCTFQVANQLKSCFLFH